MGIHQLCGDRLVLRTTPKWGRVVVTNVNGRQSNG
jgi:hypothetical protein